MARNRNFTLFENAVPLAGAWLKFAPTDRQLEFERTSGFGRTLAEQPVTDSLQGLMAGLRTSFDSWQSRQKLITEMRDWLLDELFNNQFTALGIRKLPTKGYYPVVIDPDYFDDAEIDWEHSTVTWHQTLYIDVRVSQPSEVADRPITRKGSIDAIDAAILELVANNPKFGSLPRQEACQKIRTKLGKRDIKGSGLSDQNLSKRIIYHCGTKAISK